MTVLTDQAPAFRHWLLGVRGVVDGAADSAEPAPGLLGLNDGDAQALFGFVRRLGLTDEQADDAVQEVFARLLAAQRRGIVVAKPRAWAYQSIYRLAMDEHRLRRRWSAITAMLTRRPVPDGPVDDADRIAVWAEVDRLTERQRQVVYLRYRSDLAFADIGQVLGITASAARSHSTQALATLRSRLAGDIADLEPR